MVNVTIKRRVTVGGVIYIGWVYGRPYVGQSRVLDKNRFPTQRKKRHIKDAEAGDHLPFHRAVAKYGLDDFKVLEFIEIEDVEDAVANAFNEIDDEHDAFTCEFLEDGPLKQLIQALNDAECKWIKELNSMIPEKGGCGWNVAPGGGAFDHPPHTEAHKRWMSQRMTGRKLAQATKDKLREIRSGQPLAPDHKLAIKQAAASAFQKTFDERLGEWSAQYTKLGRLPNASNPDPTEKLAASWRATILKKNGKNELDEDMKKKLDETPGWMWKIPKGGKIGRKYSEEAKRNLKEVRKKQYERNPRCNGAARYSDEEIRYIRSNPEKMNQKQLAERFKTCFQNISRIQHRQTYKHVGD
jgi:hypothetical protein